MKRSIFWCSLLCLVSVNLFAQDKGNSNKPVFFVGPQASIAAGSLDKTQSWGLGMNAQIAYPISQQNYLTGRATYSYLFGKKYSSDYYVDGGEYYTKDGKYKGMNDMSFAAGIRHNFTDHLYGGADAGLCLGFSDGDSESSYTGMFEGGYLFNGGSSLEQALALFLGICGDPKIQVGVRYSIRL